VNVHESLGLAYEVAQPSAVFKLIVHPLQKRQSWKSSR
jgi:hypothetical protein